MADNPTNSALKPDPKAAPSSNPTPTRADMGRASGVTTETRVLSSGGAASVPFAVPLISDPGSAEMVRRVMEDDIALDTAAAGGVTITRQQKAMRQRVQNASNATVSQGCQPNLNVYTGTANQGGLQGGAVGAWVCGMDTHITFRERRYQNQANEFRLYIEGADVTNYVEGSISWSIESTGGMNSCRFTLNNTQDAFIITPENICAGLNPRGWRVGSSTQVKDNPGRSNWRVDETAKYIIYRNKYNAVDPEGAAPQIDQQTGMWLFPLNPYSCIFNRHDSVRLFVRLPHVSAVRSPDRKAYDLWMPAFTGFIKDYSWDDDPVAGTRYVKVTCYDYRGILERMRIAIAGAGLPSDNPSMPEQQGSGVQSGAGAAVASASGLSTPGSYDFLKRAARLGGKWKAWFNINQVTNKNFDPYRWAFDNKIIEAFTELYKTVLAWVLVKNNLSDQPSTTGPQAAGTTVAGRQISPTDPRMGKAIRDANDLLDPMVCHVIDGVGFSFALAEEIHASTGVSYSIVYRSAASSGSGVVPKFETTQSTDKPRPKRPAPSLPANLWDAIKKRAPGAANAPDSANNSIEVQRLVARQSLIETYKKFSLARSVSAPVGTHWSLQKIVDQYYKNIAGVGRDNTLLSEQLVPVFRFFSDLSQSYKSTHASVHANTTTRPNVYVPLMELVEGSTNNPWSRLSVTGTGGSTTIEDRITVSVFKYMNHVISKSLASVTALEKETTDNPVPLKDGVQAVFKIMTADYSVTSQYNAVPVNSLRAAIGPTVYAAPWPLNYAASQMAVAYKKYVDSIARARPDAGGRHLTQLKKVAAVIQEAHKTGPSRALAGASEIRTLGGLVKKFVETDKAKAGIFADLVLQLQQGHPHPLSGMNFEQAVHFLCTKNSEFDCGVLFNATSYSASQLDRWNRVALFGSIQRPLTFREMQEIGQGTIRDFHSDFSPLKGFYHILLPANGVGIQSVVKMHTGGMDVSSPEEPTFMTRLQVLNEVCESLDYQFFVSGMGDLIFELPVYNAYPDTFGPVFNQAYTISKDWISSTISEENQDVPTAWVVSGLEDDKLKDPASTVVAEQFKKITIMNYTMVRRLGVKVDTIPLKIPGVGQLVTGGASQNALQQLAVYAAFYIQRQLARAHTLSVRFPFRPYVVPNRPLWLIPRQRIGLGMSVTHTMTPPAGACTTEVTLGYVRWMFRDGTFRFIGGGDRQPMDYMAFLSGGASYIPTEGVAAEGPLSLSNLLPRMGAPSESPSDIANRIRAANAFSVNVSASFAEIDQPPSVEDLEGTAASNAAALAYALGMSVTANAAAVQAGQQGTPGSRPMATGTATAGPPATAEEQNRAAAGASAQVSSARNPSARNPPPGSGGETSYSRTATPDFQGTGFSSESAEPPRSWERLTKLHSLAYNERRPPAKGKKYGQLNMKWNTWGMFRSSNREFYGEYMRGHRRSHTGFDIMGREGTPLLTPIALDHTTGAMDIWLQAMAKKPRTPKYPPVALFNSQPGRVRYFERNADGSRKTLFNIPAPLGVLAPEVTKHGMITNPFFVVPFTQDDTSVLSYAEYYDQMLAIKSPPAKPDTCLRPYTSSKGGRGLKVNSSGKKGLWFQGTGWYTVPHHRAEHLGISAGTRLKMRLLYAHLIHYAEDTVSRRGLLGMDYQGRVEAGTVVGYLGNTGSSRSPHLHLEVYILSPKSGTDQDAFMAVASINADYLTTQLASMVTGVEPSANSPLSPELLNQPVSAEMRANARKVLSTGKPGTRARVAEFDARAHDGMTVAQLVELYKLDPDISGFFRSKTVPMSTKGEYTSHLQTNPLFFFTPDQLVDMRGVKGATPFWPHSSAGGADGGSGPASGSPGESVAPLGQSPAYNGTSLQWCAGIVSSTRTSATIAAAKNQQAAATAGRETAADPAKKAEADEKLRQQKAKNDAQVKEAQESQKTATDNPEAVRRRFNALHGQAERNTQAPPVPGSGVSSNTGSRGR